MQKYVLQANCIVGFVSSPFGHTAVTPRNNRVKKDSSTEGQARAHWKLFW